MRFMMAVRQLLRGYHIWGVQAVQVRLLESRSIMHQEVGVGYWWPGSRLAKRNGGLLRPIVQFVTWSGERVRRRWIPSLGGIELNGTVGTVGTFITAHSCGLVVHKVRPQQGNGAVVAPVHCLRNPRLPQPGHPWALDRARVK